LTQQKKTKFMGKERKNAKILRTIGLQNVQCFGNKDVNRGGGKKKGFKGKKPRKDWSLRSARRECERTSSGRHS